MGVTGRTAGVGIVVMGGMGAVEGVGATGGIGATSWVGAIARECWRIFTMVSLVLTLVWKNSVNLLKSSLIPFRFSALVELQLCFGLIGLGAKSS